MKKALGAVAIWAGVIALSLLFYVLTPSPFVSLGKRFDDLFFIAHPAPPPSGNIVIVDIDEKSLAALGQWPWERDTFARLIRRISEQGAGIIGLDIVFAEADKTSPSYINTRKHLGLSRPADYDKVLAETFATHPVIGGYVFDMEHATPRKAPPRIPAVIIERYTDDAPEDAPGSSGTFYEARGVIPNIPIIQQHLYSSGFFNILPDASGMIRRAPLLIRYQENLYPSLDLEMIRNAVGAERITVTYGAVGVESIDVGPYRIPVDRHGALPIRFRGGAHTFPYLSAVDVLDNRTAADALSDKLVLLGSSAAGLLDLRAIPLDNAIAGVEIHANILDNILAGDLLTQPAWIDGANITLSLAVFTFAFLLFLSLDALWLPAALLLTGYGVYRLVDWILFDRGVMINTALPFVALLTALISAIVYNYFVESRLRKLIRTALARKVSPGVARELIRHSNSDVLRDREAEVTILFSDIRDFTPFSEAIGSAHDLIRFLNRYLDPMADSILAHRGTIDKFIGDAVMAYWNAPQSVPDHADAAVQSALDQLKALEAFNRQNREQGLPPIRIGIGINTGKVVVGEVGSKGRADYTIIGDSVNLASRLESLNKRYGTTLLLSEHTRRQLTRPYVLREVDRTRVKGKEELVRIFEVLQAGEPSEALQEELDRYHAALEDYYAGRLSRAQERFAALTAQTDTPLYRFHLERIEAARHSELPIG